MNDEKSKFLYEIKIYEVYLHKIKQQIVQENVSKGNQ